MRQLLEGRSPERLQSSDDHRQLFIFCRGKDHGLFRIVSEKVEALTGSPEPITAAAAVGTKVVVAVGHSLYELSEPGHPVLIFGDPASSEPRILGLAARGGTIYYSTETAVWRRAKIGIEPVVYGIGGPLRLSSGRLMVLDKRSGRPFVLRGFY